MHQTYLYALLLGAAGILAAAGGAIAQENVTGEETIEAQEATQEGATMECADGGVSGVGDAEQSLVNEWSRNQTVDVDEDDILLGIALANNGATGVDWESLRDITQTSVRFNVEARIADLDREDVFSALALGVDAESDSLAALACVSDVEATHRETTDYTRMVDLEEDDVLLAIALKNSVGGELDFEDVADISETMKATLDESRDVNVDREDTFLALALGAGGER